MGSEIPSEIHSYNEDLAIPESSSKLSSDQLEGIYQFKEWLLMFK